MKPFSIRGTNTLYYTIKIILITKSQSAIPLYKRQGPDLPLALFRQAAQEHQFYRDPPGE